MEFFVTPRNIRILLRDARLNLNVGRQELTEIENFLVSFFSGNNSEHKMFSFDEAKDFLYKAKRASLLLATDFSDSSVKKIVETIQKTDEETIDTLSRAYKSFYHAYDKTSVIETENGPVAETKNLSKKLVEWFTKIVGKTDDIYQSLTTETLEKLTDVAILYKILKPHMPKSELVKDIVVRHTDKVIDKILSNKFLENFDAQVASEVLDSLTDDELGFNKFSQKELAKLIKHASSILYKSNKEKIQSLHSIIGDYRNYLLSTVDDDEKFRDEINANINFKTLVSRSGMILVNSPESQKANFMLLTGKPISTVYKELDKKVFPGIDEEVIKKYGKLKISLDSYDLYHILTNNTSLLHLVSTNKIVQIGNDIDKVLDYVFENSNRSIRLKRDSFNLSQLLNRKNLTSLIYKNELSVQEIENFGKNILSLNKLIKDTEIFKIMQNNINLFYQDNQILDKDLKDIIAKSKNNKEKLSLLLNEYVNQRFNYKEGKSSRNSDHSNTQSHESQESLSRIDVLIDPNEQFTIEVDGGIYEKPKTFSETLKNYTLEECINHLFQIANTLEVQLADSEVDFDFNPTQTRLNIQQARKLFERSEKLIKELYKTEQNNAISYSKIINDLKINHFKKMMEDCKVYMEILNDDRPYQRRGKASHITPNTGNPVDYLTKSVELLKTVKDEEMRKFLLEQRKAFIMQYKDRIVEQNVLANIKRIKQEKSSLEIGEYYAFCSVLSSLIEDQLVDDNEQSL